MARSCHRPGWQAQKRWEKRSDRRDVSDQVSEAQHQAIPVPSGLIKTDGIRGGNWGEITKILIGDR